MTEWQPDHVGKTAILRYARARLLTYRIFCDPLRVSHELIPYFLRSYLAS